MYYQSSMLLNFFFRLENKQQKQFGQTPNTVQFKVKSVQFFYTNKFGTANIITQNVTAEVLLAVSSATLKLDNQKNGWKGIRVHDEHNGNTFLRLIGDLV